MPKPTKFLTNEEIEERAAEVLDAYVEGGRRNTKLPVDIDTLTECNFRFRVSWEAIDDPPGCRTFAALVPTPQSDLFTVKLILNQKFSDFLQSHPEIERLTRGHELCHWVVHIDEGMLRSGTLPFGNNEPEVRYHRAQYSAASLSAEEKNLLASFAFEDERAYRALKGRSAETDGCIEPDWMHRQAEHFSACLLVPRQPLYEELEGGADPAFYGTHVRLAELFGVSKRVIQIRLKKIGLIEEYEPGRFRNVRAGSRLQF
jgi:IrrE N-terminal-like domain